jgi:PAS domain S-box-containing protein
MITGLSVKVRLALLSALMLGLMAVQGLMSLLQLREVAQSLESVYADRLLPMQQLRQISTDLLVRLPAGLARVQQGQQAAAEFGRELREIEAEVDQLWARYKATQLVDEEQHLIARAEPQLRYARTLLAQLLERLESDDRTARLQDPAGQELRQGLEPLAQTLNRLIDVQLQVARRVADDSQDQVERARWYLLLAMLGSAALAALLAWWVWALHRREQLLGQAREQRLQQFYLALSQCNQLIVRDALTEPQLYAELCRICVDTGHAMLAAVIALDTEWAQRVAMQGPPELVADLPTEWALDSAYGAISITGQVMRSGEHLISNDAALDSRMAHWHGNVIARGARAIAAFPLRRGGRVVSVLQLFAAETGFFEPALVRLIDEMAGDLSYALDNLDREQARRQALHDAETGRDLFRRLFNSTSFSALVTTLAEQRVLEVNEELCRRYGLPREQLIGRRLGDLGVGLDPAQRERYYAELRRSGRVRNQQVTARSRDGRLMHSLMNGELIDYEGQACALSTSIDITGFVAAPPGAGA